jgi:anti-sigma factor RsiW
MVVLTCLRTRRRIGAYLDGALKGATAQSTARHLTGCSTCQREAEALRKMRALLQRSSGQSRVAPDWTGFWPGIVRGIEDAGRRESPPVVAQWRWWQSRWALGGAVAAVGLVSLTFWQTLPGLLTPDPPVVVSSAHTEDPRGTVMVYSTHEKDVTVVWVLGLDEPSD